MNAKQLRDSILQMAMEGKLVPQLDSEGVVEQIGPAPDEVPFEIPASWKWVHLQFACDYIQRGKSPKYSEIQSIPVIAQKCNQWDGLHIDKAKFIVPETLKSYKQERILQDQDILWNSTGLGSLGRLIEYRAHLNPYGIAVVDSHVTVIRTIKSILDPTYLYFYLRSPIVQSVIEDKANGSTKQKELSISTVKAYEVPLPPLEEQKRIVAKIEQLMPLVDDFGKVYDELEELNSSIPNKLKASILQYAMEGKLVPQLDSEGVVEQLGKAPDEVPFEIPTSWKWELLDKIGRWKAGGTPDRSISAYYQNGTINWLKTGDLNDGFIDQVEECITQQGLDNSSAHINPIGAVLIAMYGATIGKLGILNIPCATNQACCACVVNDNIIYNKYLFYYLMSQKRSFIAKGAGSGQSNISRKKIVAYPIPLPPLEEQKRIVAKIEALFEQIDRMVG